MKATMQSLIEKIESHPDFSVPQGAWVSVYRRSQNYGGPEEGGWWYNRNVGGLCLFSRNGNRRGLA